MSQYLIFFSGFAGGSLITYLVQSGYKAYKKGKDGKTVIRFMKLNTLDKEGERWRSTHRIASGTNLSESRVVEICSAHTDIKRNEKEKEMWALRRIVN